MRAPGICSCARPPGLCNVETRQAEGAACLHKVAVKVADCHQARHRRQHERRRRRARLMLGAGRRGALGVQHVDKRVHKRVPELRGGEARRRFCCRRAGGGPVEGAEALPPIRRPTMLSLAALITLGKSAGQLGPSERGHIALDFPAAPPPLQGAT